MDMDQLTSIKMTPKKRVVLKEIKIESPEEKLANITKKVKYQLENHNTIYDGGVAELIRENNKLLVENGWKPCQIIGAILPPDVLSEVYRNYNDYKAGKKSFVYKYYNENNNYLLIDTYLNVPFVDKNSAKALIKDKEHTLNYYHLEDLINRGEMHGDYALVNRNTKMWTDFPHYFYNNRKAPRDWEIPAGQTFGIEIEVNFKSAPDKLKFSNELNAVLPKWYCERDGSLEDHDSNHNKGLGGLEIISAPLNFKDLVDEAKIACDLLGKYNAKAFGAGEFFGLHVTHSLDLDAFGVVNKKQGWNYLRYLNDPKLREFWRCIARRKPNAYCVFIDDFIGNYGENPKLNTLTRGHSENNHHLATCVRDSQKAIETRIFCSTKGIKTLEATLEVIKLTSDFSKEKFDLKAYSDYVTNNASRNLASFLKSRGALYCLEAMYLPDYDDNQEDF